GSRRIGGTVRFALALRGIDAVVATREGSEIQRSGTEDLGGGVEGVRQRGRSSALRRRRGQRLLQTKQQRCQRGGSGHACAIQAGVRGGWAGKHQRGVEAAHWTGAA